MIKEFDNLIQAYLEFTKNQYISQYNLSLLEKKRQAAYTTARIDTSVTEEDMLTETREYLTYIQSVLTNPKISYSVYPKILGIAETAHRA